MADYYAYCRSNYFKVKDPEAFKTWVASFDDALKLYENTGDNTYALLVPEGYHWPACFEKLSEEPTDRDFFNELSTHLQENSIAILMEVGHERLRYLVGEAIALNHLNERVSISLNDIYALAADELGGENITEAQY